MADDQQPTSEPESPDPYAAPADPYEGATPPGYDWPTHGGYLGCLMGLIAACLLAGFLGSVTIGIISVTPLGELVGSPFARITLLVLSFVVCFGALGRLGWILGKRFYREYPQPAPRGHAVRLTRESATEQRGPARPRDHERVL